MAKPDPLQEYRQKSIQTGSVEPYEPYSLCSDQQLHLELRLGFPKPSEGFNYGFLKNIVGDWRYGTGVTLEYSFPMQIEIVGENLIDLLRALHKHKVEWIQEYDADVWGPFPEKFTKPIIKSIVVITATSVETTSTQPTRALH